MGIDGRRHERFQVHLAVKYAIAAEFVTEYVENLSIGGLFIAGAPDLVLLQEIEVDIELPEHGTWRVRAKAVFVINEATAKQLGRKPGTGMEVTFKPPGYDDALLGYLLRLGRRRDVAVMVGDVPTANAITEAGYRTIPLVDASACTTAMARSAIPVIAVVVSTPLVPAYSAAMRSAGAGDIVLWAGGPSEFPDLLARIDALLP